MDLKATIIAVVIANLYVVFGGLIFRAIEETNETAMRLNLTALFDDFVCKLLQHDTLCAWEQSASIFLHGTRDVIWEGGSMWVYHVPWYLKNIENEKN